jgi:hypothetical protein
MRVDAGEGGLHLTQRNKNLLRLVDVVGGNDGPWSDRVCPTRTAVCPLTTLESTG